MSEIPVSWTSTAPGVATVGPDGIVKAVAGGSSTIKAFAGLASGSATVTVSVPATIMTIGLRDGIVGEPYDRALVATGGAGDYDWEISSGVLPEGLSLDATTGTISGTPLAVEESTFTVRLESGEQTATKPLALKVNAPFTLGDGFGDEQFFLVPSGVFQMGSTNGDADEEPVHTVNITKPFYLQKTEITERQWLAVMEEVPMQHCREGDRCPIGAASWTLIQEFLDRLNTLDPEANYRLPTEAEWEYAARAETTGDYGGSGILSDMGWWLGSGLQHSDRQTVAKLMPNAWGLYDMHGNVWEWTQDWYSPTYYSGSPTDDPTGPTIGSLRVLRGGAYWNNELEARSANRRGDDPSWAPLGHGFRLAKTY
jgi:formylglycine-generating enzyme required for sulfatase activity